MKLTTISYQPLNEDIIFMMLRILLISGIFLLISCAGKKGDDLSEKKDSLGGKTVLRSHSFARYPRSKINYSNTISRSDIKITIDSSTIHLHSEDTIVGYRINTVTKEVVRLCAEKNAKNQIKYLLLNERKIKWDTTFGLPNEFISDYIFSDLYRGGDIEGKITKFKFKISVDRLHFLDSIPGGSYSEGAGTWEWLISAKGTPEIIVFSAEDDWSMSDTLLLLNSSLINLQTKDTLARFPIDKYVWTRSIIGHEIISLEQAQSDVACLERYDLKGQLFWTADADYMQKIVSDPISNLIIGQGYTFSDNNGPRDFFTVAYDRTSGEIKWSFPTGTAYNRDLNLNDRIEISNLFAIGNGLFGIIGGLFSHLNENLNHNELIIFDSAGRVYEPLHLSSEDQNYSVIITGKGEFEIVSNYESRKFKINLQRH